MRVERWVRVGFAGFLLAQAACLGPQVTPAATAADFGPAPATAGWTVANTFRDVSFEEFQQGGVVIVPLKAVRKVGAERDDERSSAFTYEVDVPNSNLGPRERYLWGVAPLNNGHGNFHFYHERLAFDLKSHSVAVLPRRGPANIDRAQPDGTQFWCGRDALREETISIDGYSHLGHATVCPTAFVRTTGETKGIPLLVGTQEERYVIDARRIASLIVELHLDEEVTRIKGAEDMNRQLTTIARVQEDQQRVLEAERIRTALPRGQAMIERVELGALLCSDIQIGNTPMVVSAFLEGVHDRKVQLRVNNIRSPDGRSTITLKVPVDGIEYNSGNIVWVDRPGWRACE